MAVFWPRECLQWIQNEIFTILTAHRLLMVAILDLAAVATPKVAGLGALAKSLEHALGYICAKFGAFA